MASTLPDVSLSQLFGRGPEQEQTEEVLIGFGKVNLSDTLATYASLTVEAPFKRVSAIATGKRVTGSDHRSAVSNWEGNGAIYHQKVRHAVNTVILSQVSWSRNRSGLRDGSVFIRLREKGPLLSVNAFLPLGRESTLGDRVCVFLGRGDIMDANELRVLGIEIPHRYQDTYMDQAELAECFEVIEQLPEIQPRPVIARIATDQGVQLTEMPVAPRRRLRLKR